MLQYSVEKKGNLCENIRTTVPNYRTTKATRTCGSLNNPQQYHMFKPHLVILWAVTLPHDFSRGSAASRT